MSRRSISEEAKIKDNIHITYYFTVMFIVIGTILVFSILYQLMDRLNFFMIFLSTCGGGIPMGFIGLFIDYKVSRYRLEKGSFEQ